MDGMKPRIQIACSSALSYLNCWKINCYRWCLWQAGHGSAERLSKTRNGEAVLWNCRDYDRCLYQHCQEFFFRICQKSML